MAGRAPGAGTVLDEVGRTRARTRKLRSGHWFASLVFGVVVLGALPLYLQSLPSPTPSHCRRSAHGFVACSSVGTSASAWFGRAFEARSPFSSLTRWATFYWAIAVVVGYSAVVAYYHLRARRLGVEGRLWPAVLAGVALLGVVMWVNAGQNAQPLDFWTRGMSVLVVIALGLVVLAVLERSIPFVVFAAGFFALAVLSCLYTVVNLFDRLGIGGPFRGQGELPNLVLPGAYLVAGGLFFFAARDWGPDVLVQRVRRAP